MFVVSSVSCAKKSFRIEVLLATVYTHGCDYVWNLGDSLLTLFSTLIGPSIAWDLETGGRRNHHHDDDAPWTLSMDIPGQVVCGYASQDVPSWRLQRFGFQ